MSHTADDIIYLVKTEAIYMVKSKKNDIFETLSAIFEGLNEWNKMNDYCSLFKSYTTFDMIRKCVARSCYFGLYNNTLQPTQERIKGPLLTHIMYSRCGQK